MVGQGGLGNLSSLFFFNSPKTPPWCAGGVVVLKVVSKKVTTDKSPKMVFGL
jgi:hypothetical protein